jgi:hypothetical protein
VTDKEEITQRIIKRLTEKTGRARPCAVCGHESWTVEQHFIQLSVTDNPLAVTLGGSGFPLQPIICQHCGNTQLINLLILGFSLEELKTLTYPNDQKS